MASPQSRKVAERVLIAMYKIQHFVQQQPEDQLEAYIQIIPQLIRAHSNSPKKSSNLRPDPPTGVNGLALDFSRAQVAWDTHQRWKGCKGNQRPRQKIKPNELPREALKRFYKQNAAAKLTRDQARFQELLDNFDKSCGLLLAGVMPGQRALPLGTGGASNAGENNATIDPAILDED